jgi:hypothetical protein
VRIFLLNICNLITGATRPDAERVFQNIKTTIEALSEHDCEHYALTYKTDESLKLQEKIKNENLNVNLFLIDPIEEVIGGYNGNNYRMVRCIELLAEKVENLLSFDCVLRHRIDCELLSIEVPEVIKENTYYAPWMPWNLPFDNIGLMTPEVFKKVFHTEGKSFEEPTPHHTINQSIVTQGLQTEPFNFKKRLYQSSDPEFMGVPQWSKENRTFHHQDEWVTIH